MDNVVYTLNEEQLNAWLVGRSYLELWRGLPMGFDFRRVDSGRGEGSLVYETGRDYIWVPAPTARLIESSDGRQILSAHRVS